MIRNKAQFLIDLATKLATNKKPVVYIAGKVTGLPVEEYKAHFAKAQKKLEAENLFVLNPCEFIDPDLDWRTAMRISFILLSNADHIYLLSNWKKSRGATMEFQAAVEFGISSITES